MRKLFEQEYKKYEKSLFFVAVGYLHNPKKELQQNGFQNRIAYSSFAFIPFSEATAFP